MIRLWFDSETRSHLPLATRGHYKYATQAEVMIVTWAVDDGPVGCYDLMSRRPPPRALLRAINEVIEDPESEVWAHNATFDRVLWRRTKLLRQIPLERWHCTMALAYQHGLPGGLEKLCEIFHIPYEEAKGQGKKYIDIFCKPRKRDGQYNDARSHPEDWKGFLRYAKQDIVAMRAVWRKLPKWNCNATERELYLLNEHMSDDGLYTDLPLARGAIKAVRSKAGKLAARTEALTEGHVLKTTQRDKLLVWMLQTHGVELPDLKADTVERRLNDPDLPESVKELLRIRVQASKSSTTKYQRCLDAEIDGYLHGTQVYCGALRTGRWAARLIQPHNFPRPKYKQPRIDEAIELLYSGDLELVEDDIMGLCSSALRGLLIAPPGYKLVVSDLSNIEGRMLAWLAGETWKVQAFRDFDAGRTKHDMYKVSAGKMYGIDPATIDDDIRQHGKVSELSLGYFGGVGAFVTMAETYRIDLEDVAKAVWPTLSGEVRIRAHRRWLKAVDERETFDLPQRTYEVCSALVMLWRKAHPATVAYWSQIERAVRTAIMVPGKRFTVRNIQIDRQGAWLRIRLPSGRYLCYPSPKIDGDNDISYAGVSPYSRRWGKIYTYSGKVVENIDQATSRDVIAAAVIRAKKAGYDPRLLIHDSIVSYVKADDRTRNAVALSKLISQNEPWNAGLPLSAKGFEGPRYVSEK